MSIRPFLQYLDAEELLRQGEEPAAAQALAVALGGDPAMGPSSIIKENLRTLLDRTTISGEAVLQIIRTEVGKRERGQ